MSEVRIGTREDEPHLLRLLTLMHSEGGMFSLDITRAQEMFSVAFDARGGVLGVIGPPDDLQAAIFLLITRYWYTSEYHLEELFCFVHPAHRKSMHANKLLDFSKECSERLKLELSIGVLTNVDAEGKLKLYYRKFGTPAGAFFAFGAKWVNGRKPDDQFWKALFPNRFRKRPNGLHPPPQQLSA